MSRVIWLLQVLCNLAEIFLCFKRQLQFSCQQFLINSRSSRFLSTTLPSVSVVLSLPGATEAHKQEYKALEMAVRALFLFVLLFCLCVYCQSKQCVRFQDSPLVGCAAAGYNYTYPLPDDLSSKTVFFINRFVNTITKAVKNCSVAQMAEIIACMPYAPKCVDVNKDPILPCRRVCSELMKRCYTSISPWLADWMLRECLVLPNETAASGKCYEPKGFDKYYNASTSGPLERGCQKIDRFPFCDNMGYNHTMLSDKLQAMAYKFFYRKNITDPNPNTPAPGSILAKVMSTMKASPKCAKDIQKIFCSEVFPPCFPDEGPKYYTVCKPVCKSLGENCPELLTGRGNLYYGECERMAPGMTSHGFCKHSKLPPITDWGKYWPERTKPTTKTPSKGLSTTAIIIISVVIPSVVIIIIIAAVIIFKKRKLTKMFDYQRHDE